MFKSRSRIKLTIEQCATNESSPRLYVELERFVNMDVFQASFEFRWQTFLSLPDRVFTRRDSSMMHSRFAHGACLYSSNQVQSCIAASHEAIRVDDYISAVVGII